MTDNQIEIKARFKVFGTCDYCKSNSGIRDQDGNCIDCGAKLETTLEKWERCADDVIRAKQSSDNKKLSVIINPFCWNGGALFYYRTGIFKTIRWIADKLNMPRLYNLTIKTKWITGLKYL